MAERATIARPYARAAFAHSRENASLDAWSTWLGTARAVVQSDEYHSLASSPGIGKAQLVELIAGSSARRSIRMAVHFSTCSLKTIASVSCRRLPGTSKS